MKKAKTKEEAEKIVSETIKKIVSQNNDVGVDEVIKRVDEALQSNNELVQGVMKKSILVRGSIIEMSIHLEAILNEILLQYYDPKNHDNFKKDFLFKTLSLSQKKDIINTILKNEQLKEKLDISSDFGSNFNEFIRIRNIYAHYPEDVFNDEGSIEVAHNEFESIKELNRKFYEIIQKLFADLNKISIFVAEEAIKHGLEKNKN